MKHLRRNRSASVSSPSSSSHTHAVSGPAPLSSAAAAAARAAERERASHETPLYARFTSARRGHDGSAPALKPLVSGPIALAPKKLGQTPVPVPHVASPTAAPQHQSQESIQPSAHRGASRGTEHTQLRDAEKQQHRAERGQIGDSTRKVEEMGDDAPRQEMSRVPSKETALSGTSGSSGVGRHGTRVDGERVLLPARKVTRKRGDADKARDRDEKARAVESAETRAGTRVEANGEAFSKRDREGGRPVAEDQVRVVGDRVLLPARKVTRKRPGAGDEKEDAPPGHARPALQDARQDSAGTASSSAGANPRPARHHELQKAGSVEKARARAKSPDSQSSSSSPIVFPVPSPHAVTVPGSGISAPSRAVGVAVVVVDPEGGEDKFSVPKRARMHTLATTTPASNSAPSSSFSASSGPKSPTRPTADGSSQTQTFQGTKPGGGEGGLTASAPSKAAAPPSEPSTSGAGPTRRRKYSLRAAFGLPVARNASDSEASTGAVGQSTSSNVTHYAKPPSPPPFSAPPPATDSASKPAASASNEHPAESAGVGEEAYLGLHSSSVTPRDRRAAPEQLLQLQSLHLSGFSFPLDAILAGDDSDGAAKDPPTPVPHIPPLPPTQSPPPAAGDAAVGVHVQPPSPVATDRPAVIKPGGEAPSLPDPHTAQGDYLPERASSPAQQQSKAQDRPSSPGTSPVPATSTPTVTFDIPPRPAPTPIQNAPHSHHQQHHQQKPLQKASGAQRQKLHNVHRPFDLDHSLLPPESDTRYPIPRRRSPTSPPEPAPRAKKSSPPRMLPPGPCTSPEPSTHRGPVQGRPLIFAAMAAAEAEAEIIEPKAWMAVATLDANGRASPDTPARMERSDGSSHFVNGYPTPRSTSPKLPERPHPETPHQPATAPQIGRSISEPTADSPNAKEPATRRPSASNLQSPQSASKNLPTPPEPQQQLRPRKLSKSRPRVARLNDASEQQQQPQQQPSHRHHEHHPHPPHSTTLGAKPPTPVEDAPPPSRTRDASSRHASQSAPSTPVNDVATATQGIATSLGSPINLRNDKPLPERRSAEASRSPPPRVISSESPVPSRPVKVLTERQMEKLNATKGVPGPNGVPSSSRRRHEHTAPASSPPAQARSLPPHSNAVPDERYAPRTTGAHRTDDAPPTIQRKRLPEEPKVVEPLPQPQSPPPEPPRSPTSPDEYATARNRRRGKALEKARPAGIEHVAPAVDPIPDPVPDSATSTQDPEPVPEPEEPKEPTFYPLEKHVTEPPLLTQLVGYLAFADWLALSSTSKAIRIRLHEDRELAEPVLERYLRTVGYKRWVFAENDPLTLTLTDLNAYMRAVSLPLHQFARYAEIYLQTPNRERDRKQRAIVESLRVSCRSYNRVVLRLRAQAEAEARAAMNSRDAPKSPTSPTSPRFPPSSKAVNNTAAPSKKAFSRSSSRAPSPTSTFSRSQNGHARAPSLPGQSSASPSVNGTGPTGGSTFNSPLFRIRRAPLLQVFVPSPEGDWLSDTSVLECEKELKRAGVLHLLRPGDVVWDTAVGDEANVGRMLWDGSYLIDLDYTYSRVGDLPKYLPTLAFPPSYFHRVVRTMGSGNPVCHIDVAPWGEEIAANLQLLQDRMKTETPQGGHHMVVRWVHRSSFTIRPSSSGKPIPLSVPRDVGPGPGPGGAWFIDPGWFGTVIIEAEGTNEGLADLQARCQGAFPPRAVGAAANLSPERSAREQEQRNVFRILREKSRPGEIWIRTVTHKERLLPP